MTRDLSAEMKAKREETSDGLRAIIAVIQMMAPRDSKGVLPRRYQRWIAVLEKEIETWERWEKGVGGWKSPSDPRD